MSNQLGPFRECVWGLGVRLCLQWNLLQQMLQMLCSSNRPGFEGAINPMRMPDCRQSQSLMLRPWHKKRLIAFIDFSGHNLQNVQPSGNLTESQNFCMFTGRLWENLCDWSCAMSVKWQLSVKLGESQPHLWANGKDLIYNTYSDI